MPDPKDSHEAEARAPDGPERDAKAWSAPILTAVSPVSGTRSGGFAPGPEGLFYDIS